MKSRAERDRIGYYESICCNELHVAWWCNTRHDQKVQRDCSCCESTAHIMVLHVQQERTVSLVSQYRAGHRDIDATSGPAFVTMCTCIFEILCRAENKHQIWSQTKGTLQWKPLKFFSKPTAIKQWTLEASFALQEGQNIAGGWGDSPRNWVHCAWGSDHHQGHCWNCQRDIWNSSGNPHVRFEHSMHRVKLQMRTCMSQTHVTQVPMSIVQRHTAYRLMGVLFLLLHCTLCSFTTGTVSNFWSHLILHPTCTSLQQTDNSKHNSKSYQGWLLYKMILFHQKNLTKLF